MIVSLILSTLLTLAAPQNPPVVEGIQGYVPTPQVLASRERFADDKFGVFIHWGVYSMLGRGEWVMSNEHISYPDYSMLPGGFYPSKFNASEWVAAIKAAGARYITITSRHHDGFSMFATKASPYNIVDATPFKRDVLKELADACHEQGITLNFYYSLVDWGRGDYPQGNNGGKVGKDPKLADYGAYCDFMCNQITELLTNYGEIGCIWFDGDWDQIKKKEDGSYPDIDFDWQYGRIYRLIHSLQPGCLVGNNHHRIPIPGEDIQIFERDVPGENTAGYSRTDVVSTSLPLETCQTMNTSWGFKIDDHKYKSVPELLRLLIRTAGRNANLLLNVGPQPDGCIPAESLEHLAGMGRWLKANGETIYGTRSSYLRPQPWGVQTDKGNKIYLHVMEAPEDGTIVLPYKLKVKEVKHFGTNEQISYKRKKDLVTIYVPEGIDCSIDYIIEVTLK